MSNIVFTFLFHCKNPLCNAVFPFLMEDGEGERKWLLSGDIHDKHGVNDGASNGENTRMRNRSGGFDEDAR